MSNNKSERTQADMLDAAWTLIAARGADVSMADVAKAVGMTRQSVYVHFGSRGGLLMALVKRADDRERIIENFEAALETKAPAERLDACLKVWFAFVIKIQPVARDLIRLRPTDDEAGRAWDDRMRVLLGLFTALTRSLHADGALAQGWTVAKAADYLWAACSVQSWSLLVFERGWSERKAGEAIRTSMARTLLP